FFAAEAESLGPRFRGDDGDARVNAVAQPATAAPLIEVEKLEAWYGRRRVLHGIDFTVNPGEIRVIMGGSGSGKSTLLRHLLGLQRPRSGSVRLLGTDIGKASEREMLAVRRQIGVSFQGGALLTSLSVGDNVALPLREHTDLDENTVRIMSRLMMRTVFSSRSVCSRSGSATLSPTLSDVSSAPPWNDTPICRLTASISRSLALPMSVSSRRTEPL